MKSKSPTKRSKKALVVLLVLASGVTLGIFLLIPSEPKYQGKSLTEWLKTYSNGNEKEKEAAKEAVNHIGSNAVPVLLKKLQTDDRHWKPMAQRWNRILSKIAPTKIADAMEMDDERELHNQWQAQYGFYLIGSNGNSAVPVLGRLLYEPQHKMDAANCLGSIKTPEALAVLAPGLTNSDVKFRFLCLDAIYGFEPATLGAVADKIWALRNDRDEEIADAALSLIAVLFPEDRTAPVFIEKLNDSRVHVQRAALKGLMFGPESAMEPIARYGLSSQDKMNRGIASNALFMINPQRAAEFGVDTNGLTAEDLARRDRIIARYKELKKERALHQ